MPATLAGSGTGATALAAFGTVLSS